MGKRDRVNMVITKQSLRFAFKKRGQDDKSIQVHEVMLPKGTMKEGAIADYDAFVDIVKALVKEHGYRRKNLAFCLVDDTVYIQEVTIPGILTEDECIAYIETQTGHEFELPFDDATVTVDILQQTKKHTRVRLYAYPAAKIQAFIDAFSDAGLKPVLADLTSLSVYRYYENSVNTPKKHVLLVHWNRDALYLTAFDRNKAVFSRHLRMDLDRELKPGATHDAILPFVHDIMHTLDFYHDSVIKGRAGIEELIVSGDFPYLYDVKHMLTDALGLPVFAFKKRDVPVTRKSVRAGANTKQKPRVKSTRSTRGIPVHLEKESNREMQDRVRYMDVHGLGYKEDTAKSDRPSTLVDLNFIVKEKKEIKPKRVIVSVLALFLSLSIGALFFQWNAVNGTQEIADQLIEQEKALAAAKSPNGELADAAVWLALDDLKQQATPHVRVYNYVRDRLAGASIQTFEFTDAQSAIVNADFETLDDVTIFTTRLQESPAVMSVEAGDAKQAKNGRYNASVTLLIEPRFFNQEGEMTE